MPDQGPDVVVCDGRPALRIKTGNARISVRCPSAGCAIPPGAARLRNAPTVSWRISKPYGNRLAARSCSRSDWTNKRSGFREDLRAGQAVWWSMQKKDNSNYNLPTCRARPGSGKRTLKGWHRAPRRRPSRTAFSFLLQTYYLDNQFVACQANFFQKFTSATQVAIARISKLTIS